MSLSPKDLAAFKAGQTTGADALRPELMGFDPLGESRPPQGRHPLDRSRTQDDGARTRAYLTLSETEAEGSHPATRALHRRQRGDDDAALERDMQRLRVRHEG